MFYFLLFRVHYYWLVKIEKIWFANSFTPLCYDNLSGVLKTIFCKHFYVILKRSLEIQKAHIETELEFIQRNISSVN